MTNFALEDWAKVQAEYESGVDSLANIARRYGISDAAIAMRATRKGWVRDPEVRAKIILERDAAVAAAYEEHKKQVLVTSAHVQASVIVAHRKDIERARKLVSNPLDELTDVTEHRETFEELGDIMHNPDERGRDRLNKVYHKVISLPERSTALNTLSTALKSLISLERQAYNIDGALVDPEAPKDTAEVIRGLDKIMDKFNQVLALQVTESPAAKAAEVIIDVSTRVKAETSNSPV
jgi:hypothetical protein